MPEGMPNAAGAPPAPSGGAPPPQGQAGGAGGATMPTPNRGLEAQAQARLAVLAQGMSALLAAFPAGSDAARDIREALNKIAKHVAPGQTSQGVQMSEAQRQLMQQKQMAPQMAAMRAAQPAVQPAGAAGGAMPPAAA